jgi:hypothetical protein
MKFNYLQHQTDYDMKEKRDLERVRCYYYLKVYEKDSLNDIGSVVDITVKGMKIISENPFNQDKSYQFVIRLPKGYIRGHSFDINAQLRWCQKSSGSEFYEAGFKFLNAEKTCVLFIKSLISDFKHKALL